MRALDAGRAFGGFDALAGLFGQGAVMDYSSIPFSATQTHLNGNAIVALLGELDMDTAPDLAAALDELIQGGPPHVVLDFSELSFIDSSGIAVLIAAQERLRRQGRHLVVRSPKPAALKVFEITDLTEYLHVQTNQPAE